MLKQLKSLPTWRFWVLAIAIFVPIWTLTFIGYKFIDAAERIDLKAAWLEIQINKTNDVIQATKDINNSVSKTVQQLNDQIDQLSASLPAASSQTNIELLKLKNSIASVQPIPEFKLNQIQKDIENLKNNVSKK